MKAYRINVITKQVEQIELDGTLQAIYDAIGNGCDMIESPHTFYRADKPFGGDALYCDEDGCSHPFVGAFAIKGSVFAIQGNAVVVGIDENGEDVEPSLSIDEIRSQIIFDDSRFMLPPTQAN